MDKKDINNGLKARLDTLSPSPAYSWPNVKSSVDRPWVEVSINATGRDDPSLKGGSILREEGLLTCVVVYDLSADGGEDGANDLADRIANLFISGTKLSITNGEIFFRTAPEIRGGFVDGNEWRVPVVIRYVAVSTE